MEGEAQRGRESEPASVAKINEDCDKLWSGDGRGKDRIRQMEV